MTYTDVSTLLELSTEIAPPTVFAVDGEEYRILGFEHMGKADEAKTLALFARHTRLNRRLEEGKKPTEAERIAMAIRDTRMDLISTLTDLPRGIAEKLPMSAQVKLLRFISKEAGAIGDDEDDEVGEGAEAEDDDI